MFLQAVAAARVRMCLGFAGTFSHVISGDKAWTAQASKPMRFNNSLQQVPYNSVIHTTAYRISLCRRVWLLPAQIDGSAGCCFLVPLVPVLLAAGPGTVVSHVKAPQNSFMTQSCSSQHHSEEAEEAIPAMPCFSSFPCLGCECVQQTRASLTALCRPSTLVTMSISKKSWTKRPGGPLALQRAHVMAGHAEIVFCKPAY
jgi:hypothetical protein